MKQALHIFKKDVRHLRIEIGVILALTFAFAISGANVDPTNDGHLADSFELLLPVVWWFLIARVIHTEAIPGDHQFWLTRPYDRKSLLVAKVLSVLAFINLPMLAAHIAILATNDLPPSANVAGLLWEQVLLSAVLVLPAAALAAMTGRVAHFALAGILMAFGTIALTGGPSRLRQISWIPDSGAVAVIVLLGTAVVLLQFLRRKTIVSRAIAASGTVLGSVAFMLVTWNSAFAVQAWLAPYRNPISISLDQSRPRINHYAPGAWRPRGEILFEIPLQVTGIDLERMNRDSSEFTVETPLGALRASSAYIERFPQGFSALLGLERPDFEKFGNTHVRIRGSLLLTELGDVRSTPVAVGGPPVDVPGVGNCFTAPFSGVERNQIICRAAFRWPGRSVEVRTSTDVHRAIGNGYSYSPFPAELAIRPVVTERTLLNPDDERVEVLTRDPISHVRVDFEIPDVRLADYLPLR